MQYKKKNNFTVYLFQRTTTEMVEVNKTMVVEYPGRCPAHHLSCCEGYEKVGNQCLGMC